MPIVPGHNSHEDSAYTVDNHDNTPSEDTQESGMQETQTTPVKTSAPHRIIININDAVWAKLSADAEEDSKSPSQLIKDTIYGIYAEPLELTSKERAKLERQERIIREAELARAELKDTSHRVPTPKLLHAHP